MRTKTILSKKTMSERTIKLKPYKLKKSLEERILELIKNKGEINRTAIYRNLTWNTYTAERVSKLIREGILKERSCDCGQGRFVSVNKHKISNI